MKAKRKVCIISFSDLGSDPRVCRQIFALKDRYDVTALGLKRSEIKGINEFLIPDLKTFFGRVGSRLMFFFARLFKCLYKVYLKKKYPIKEVNNVLKNHRFDLVVANDLNSLVITHSINQLKEAKTLLDAHEYEPRRIENQWFRRLFVNPYKDFLCKNYLPSVAAMTTVSSGIAEEFNKVYGVKPVVIMNTPKYEEINFKDINPDDIRIIFHGVAQPSRNIESMIYIMKFLEERFNLTLMLVVRDQRYFKYLKKLRDKVCPKNVSFREPVPFDNIVRTISQYDIGFIIYRPTSFNIKYSLPNKLFESIMAGLCIISGPLFDIKKVIEEYNCGFVTDSFKIENIAKMINSLTLKDIMEKKEASLKAAKVLNAEREMKKFKEIVKNLIGY
jgi:hypothetical protein